MSHRRRFLSPPFSQEAANFLTGNNKFQFASSSPSSLSCILIYYRNRVDDEHIEERFVQNIASDCQDGILLSYLIESVTSTKLSAKEIIRNPNTAEEKLQNLNACLNHLTKLGIDVNGVCAFDIYSSNLKPIFTLFYKLSRFKPRKSISAHQTPVKANFLPCSFSEKPLFSYSSSPTLLNSGDETMPSKLPQKRDTRIPAPRYSSATQLTQKKSSVDSSTKKANENSFPKSIPTPLPPKANAIPVTEKSVIPKASIPKPPTSLIVRRSLPPVSDTLTNSDAAKSKPKMKMKSSSSTSSGFSSNTSNSSLSVNETVNSDAPKKAGDECAPKRNLRPSGLLPPKIRPNSKSFDKDESGISMLKPKPIASRIILASAKPKANSCVPEKEKPKSGQEDEQCEEEKREANIARVPPNRREVTNNDDYDVLISPPPFDNMTKAQVNRVSSETAEISKDLKLNLPKINDSFSLTSKMNQNDEQLKLVQHTNKFVDPISQQRHVRLIDETAHSDSECTRNKMKPFYSLTSMKNYQIHTIPDTIAEVLGKACEDTISNLEFDCAPKFSFARKLSTPPPIPSSAITQYRRLSNLAEFRGSCASLLSGSSTNSAQMTITVEQKDREINRLKNTIQLLRKECEEYNQSNGKNSSDHHESKAQTLGKMRSLRSASSDRDESNSNGWFRKVLKKHKSRKDEFSDADELSLAAPESPQMKPKSSSDERESEIVKELKKELFEKEKLLTELRLEALTTRSQMETIKEQMNAMSIQLEAMRRENGYLQQQIHRRSITSSIGSLNSAKDLVDYENRAMLGDGIQS
ncbi:Neuron navigator 2-like protein, partial [Dinothrombium tinctorium]